MVTVTRVMTEVEGEQYFRETVKKRICCIIQSNFLLSLKDTDNMKKF